MACEGEKRLSLQPEPWKGRTATATQYRRAQPWPTKPVQKRPVYLWAIPFHQEAALSYSSVAVASQVLLEMGSVPAGNVARYPGLLERTLQPGVAGTVTELVRSEQQLTRINQSVYNQMQTMQSQQEDRR